jgi:hypothetical protein
VLKLAGLAAITVLGAAPYASTHAQAAYEIYFRTPSRNIECSVFEPRRADIGTVRCVVLSTKNRVGEPLEWTLDFWRHVEVFRTNQGVVGTPVRTLAYGQTLQLGWVRCVSRKAGLTCLSRHSHHGFTLSRQRHVTF